ncbi:hypothetical protein FB446DRAFT_776571 [Lentinula raphanica]|nr:hypothetical protein FB446DRAFT_776571 [Lentinula raphanica]
MDYSQLMQQSLQTMLAQNPQLILQFLRQTQPSPASPDQMAPSLLLQSQPQPPVASVQHTQTPTANVLNSTPIATVPVSTPLTMVPGADTMAPASAPVTMAPPPPLSALILPSNPSPLPVPLSGSSHLVPQAETGSTVLQSQAIRPISSYISPLPMISTVSSRSLGSALPVPLSTSSSSPFQSVTAIERANNARLEHAAQMVGSSSHGMTRKKKRGPGRKAPSLYGAVESPKIEDSIAVADDGTQVRAEEDEYNVYEVRRRFGVGNDQRSRRH